ncbi:MAG: hypothetical protein R3C14_46450 [Caldilineaceae bacterium]
MLSALDFIAAALLAELHGLLSTGGLPQQGNDGNFLFAPHGVCKI